MDIGVNLVESYLRLTGYLTLSEFEVQRRKPDGTFKTVTDIDVMAIRMPGEVFLADPHRRDDCEMMLLDDPVLQLEEDCVDVIIGEVKQGHAELNPGIKDHGVLHSVLRRAEWLYDGDLDDVIQELQRDLISFTPARGGDGRIRTRLVAFGRAEESDLHTIQISHMIDTMLRFFDEHEEAFKPVQFRDPAPAFLRLLLKAGFDVSRP
ncbi:MAG: hypothetical protein KJN71_03840 [Acidimicrobiia bacterium]|nr:hypothetical protein [Acidimicrobiia bacterium]